MGRDDWKYDEESWEGSEGREEEGKSLPPEVQCPHCLHWVPRDTPYCAWCMKPLDPKK